MDRTDYRYNLEYRARVRATVLGLANSFLNGELGLIEAARKLSQFAELEPEFWGSIRVFIGINSETDALPTGDVRALWDAKALEREDQKIAAAERRWADAAKKAAQEIGACSRAAPSQSSLQSALGHSSSSRKLPSSFSPSIQVSPSRLIIWSGATPACSASASASS